MQTTQNSHIKPKVFHKGHRSSVIKHQAKIGHRILALFLIFTVLLPSIIPYNNLWANNNGPVAPEAASFEPVDATDMVNLLTGNMSYVLPVLNVPSPEGGYPVALSYHAGIAMDQESSWVGLGWNLNPGAINRSVNGYPDDWGKTRVSDLYYDKGGEKNYYSFSIGGTLPNGVTLGMSAGWGDYKAWGGIVGYAGVTAQFGSGGYFGLNYSIPGTGIGISLASSNESATNLGVSFGTSKSVGGLRASAGVSYSLTDSSLSANASVNGTGVSFNSSNNGFKLSSSLESTSTGTTTTENDYHIIDNESGFDIDVGFFWASYKHRYVSYSLFKDVDSYVSGAANLYLNSKGSDGHYNKTDESSADIKRYVVDDYREIEQFNPYVNGEYFASGLSGTVAYINFDNYSISAQGVSGIISPELNEEVYLYEKLIDKSTTNGYGVPLVNVHSNLMNFNSENLRPKNFNPNLYTLGNKINFQFKGANSSFFRKKTGDFISTKLINESNIYSIKDFEDELFASFDTKSDLTYESDYAASGHLKTSNGKKRNGNNIDAYTNEQIIKQHTGRGIIEPNNFDRESSLIPKEGIGGYKVTTVDGKTYHYSLPVYHFESFYKNFGKDDNEFDAFFESKKTAPYATHWLLTAVTGPDFFDVNSNNKVDEEDYGYWVEFDYGKWSDGFGWRSPKVGFKELDDSNTYFWGVKQVYYLDAIKTRTHTALFLKSERTDDKSSALSHYSNKYTGSGSIHPYCKVLTSKKTERVSEALYKDDRTPYISSIVFNSQRQDWKYIDIPEQKSLKLDKILILKNEDAIYTKHPNNTLNNTFSRAYSYYNNGLVHSLSVLGSAVVGWGVKDYPKLNVYEYNLNKNVLTTADISNSTLYQKALKTIVFNYDYGLGNNLLNAESGHLSLRSVDVKGKSGQQLVPPFRFEYLKSNTDYDLDNQDSWGYVKDNPDAYSLNKITTPTGSVIDIEYDEDSFYAEALVGETEFKFTHYFKYSVIPNDSLGDDTSGPLRFNDGTFREKYSRFYRINSFEKDTNYLKVYFGSLKASGGEEIFLNDLYKVGEDEYVEFDFPNYGTASFPRIYLVGFSVVNVNIEENSVTFLRHSEDDSKFDRVSTVCNYKSNGVLEPFQDDYCIETIKLNKIQYKLASDYFSEVQKGGGIRVKNISVTNGLEKLSTQYDYFDPYKNRISGITSYEPFDDVRKDIDYIEAIPSPNVTYEYVTTRNFDNNNKLINKDIYRFNVLKPVNEVFLSVTDPNKIYSLGESFNVYREESNLNLENSQFKKTNSTITEYSIENARTGVGLKKHTIHDFTSQLGRLVSHKKYNKSDQLIYSKENVYKKFDLGKDFSQGIFQESTKRIKKFEGRIVGSSRRYYNYTFESSSKVEYPNVLEKSVVFENGSRRTTEFGDFDFLTGQALSTTTYNGKGKAYKTITVPAYHNYKGMGSIADDRYNKNMLSQNSAVFSYFKQNSTRWELHNANIQTWNPYLYDTGITNLFSCNNCDKSKLPSSTKVIDSVWRKHKTYAWKGALKNDGSYDMSDFKEFKWGKNDIQDTGWQKLSEITKYNDYSRPLETMDINGNKASNKLGDNDSKVFATCNSSYDDMFYSGAEDQYTTINSSGGVIIGSLTSPIGISHTGGKSYYVPAGRNGFGVYEVGTANNYKASVWVYNKNSYKDTYLGIKFENGFGEESVSFNPNEVVFSGDWVQLNFYTYLDTSKRWISLKNSEKTVIYDDFRLYPVESTMTSYVYNKWDELECILGPNNMGTKFEYDAAGRLVKSYSEVAKNATDIGGFKLNKEIRYNYKR